MSHKYLKEINFDFNSDKTCIPNTDKIEKKRQKRFNKQRKKYGFDERETWAMDFTLACWLYERIRWYQDFAPIDTTFHKIEIPIVTKIKKDGTLKTKKKLVTQKKAMKEILAHTKFFLENQYGYTPTDYDPALEKEAYAHFEIALKILQKLIYVMWW